MNQLAIDIPMPTATFHAEDFMVSESNKLAYQRLMAEPIESGKMLCLCGGESSGKSHLAALWAAQNSAPIIHLKDVGNTASHQLTHGSSALVIEGADAICDTSDASILNAMFHLMQHCISESITLIITSRTPPMRWGLALKDLQSRLSLCELITLNAPDDALLEMVLMKHFSDRQLRVAPEVRHYLMKRIDRSFTAASDMVAMLDEAALKAKRDITLPFVKQVWQ